MDLPINHFKRAIKSGQLQIGLWCSLASHISAEILSGSGFDWLLLDTEHSPNELPMVYGQLQAVAAGGRAHPIVRIPWNDMVVIKRYLDAGVQTLLIPTVQTEDEAKQAVAATRYPPRGVRGFASASRSSRFGRIKDYHTRAEDEICVLLQIETRQGLENLEAIARVEGVDGVFIGPGDLSAGLGYVGNQGHPEVQRVIEDAIGRIKACGNIPGILTGDETFARRSIELGCLFTAVAPIRACCAGFGTARGPVQRLMPAAISLLAAHWRPDSSAAPAGVVGIIPVISKPGGVRSCKPVSPRAHG